MNLKAELISTIRDVPDFPKPGILFKDITPILHNQVLCTAIVDDYVSRFSTHRIDAIVGVESRGFLFGMMLANKLNVPFVTVRKAGKLPYTTISHEYQLEYGSAKVEIHTDAIQKNWNVLIHDDLLATGGTAAAAAELVHKLGGNVAGFAFVIELGFLGGQKNLLPYSKTIYSSVVY